MKITKISVQRADKTGQPFVSQYSGKEQVKVAIQVESPMYQDKWISGFFDMPHPAEQWKIGQDVDIDIVQKGNFFNFKVRKAGQAPQAGGYAQLFEKLFTKLDNIERKVNEIAGNFGLAERPPLDDKKIDDIPF